MNIVKKGNDAIFSVFLFKDNKGGLKLTEDNVQDFEPLNVYDPNIEPRLRDSIRIEVEHLYPTYLQDVPHRAGNALNEVRVELPADLQQLGDFNVVVNFEYNATELEDGWRAVRLKGFLCKVVETDAETDESTSPLRLFVSPILKGDKGERGEKGEQGERGEKGDKGDKGDPPKITLEEDPTDNRHYLKIEGEYVTNSKGEKIVFPANTSDLIKYAPPIPTPIRYEQSYNAGYFYGWRDSDDERVRGVFTSFSSVETIGNWSNANYALTPPWSGHTKSGYYVYGFYMYLYDMGNQPIYEPMRAGRRFALVLRIKTDGEGQVTISGVSSSKVISVNTPDSVACDVAFPCEVSTGRIRIEVKTPNTTNLGGASFVITDFRFVELDKDDKELDRLYY